MHAISLSLQEPEAFTSLYNHTQLTVFRFIYGLHGGPVEEVEDIACDTYLRAWNKRSSFSGDEHDALCWLFTIARRLVIDVHRHRKARHYQIEISLDESDFEMSSPNITDTPEVQAVSHEQFTQLWKILQNLPADKRELLVLRYMLGWKVKDIADYLRKEENTVSVYIKRSLEQVRSEWPLEETRR
jgi:RNA polymerase sigma-70 factor (ECF subfamily)